MATTIKEIAGMLGLSVATVSRSLNDKSDISEETKERVRKLANGLNYQPSEIARGLVLQRTNTFGLAISNLSHPLYAEIAEKIEENARKNNYAVILSSGTEGIGNQIEKFRGRRVDGLMLGPIFRNHHIEYIWRLKKDKFPFVLFGNIENVETDYVTVNRVKGTYLAIKHLIDLSHKKIGYLCLPVEDMSSPTKLKGFEKAIYEAHLPLKNEWIVKGEGTRESGYKKMKELLLLKDRPTCLFAHNDLAAIGAMKVIRDVGLKVPDDISLIGFDNIKEGEYLDTPLTTVDQPKEEIGKRLVEVLLERIEHAEKPLQQIVLEAELIIRNSCAPPRK